MECPGLSSLLSHVRFELENPAEPYESTCLWKVASVDERFGAVTLDLEGVGARGVVVAFFRPEIQLQPSYREIQARAPHGLFVGQRALVIGGSRGIGEVVAKALAAGGADVHLTYAQGSEDALRVQSEIAEGGGLAEVSRFDVLTPDTTSILAFRPTHLYYFATPPIFVAGRDQFSPALFEKFCSFYVTGFVQTVSSLRSARTSPLKVLYPSSVAVERAPRNMGEYVAAKAAGEAVCDYLRRPGSNIEILAHRFPRVATDQTASLLPVRSADALTVLLPLLEAMR
jgi:NAD(P)-dependent dehydrogenase (short-subunit alcohol dehydrogenase family)